MTTNEDPLRAAPKWMDDSVAVLTVVGSRMRGTERPESDWDRFGVCVEPLAVALGVSGFAQFTHQDGESDVTVYGLKRACQLALKGNPSLVENLFAPAWCWERADPVRALPVVLKLRELCTSKQTLANFGGYLRSQARRLERGTSPEGKRAALVEEHGYDTKFAAHAVRLGLQGYEFTTTRAITLPLEESVREECNAVLDGQLSLTQVLRRIAQLDDLLSTEISKCEWERPVAGARLDEWLVDAYLAWDRREPPVQ